MLPASARACVLVPLILVFTTQIGCNDSPVGVWKLDRASTMPDTSSMLSDDARQLFRQNYLRSIPEITITIQSDGSFTAVSTLVGETEPIGPTQRGTWTLSDDGLLTLDPDNPAGTNGSFRFEDDTIIQVNRPGPSGRTSSVEIIYRRAG